MGEQNEKGSEQITNGAERSLAIEAKREVERDDKRTREPLVFFDLNDKGKPKKTILNFKTILYHYGVSLKYDVIRREIVYCLKDEGVRKTIKAQGQIDTLVTYLLDACYKEGVGANRDNIYNWLSYIAHEADFNHVKQSLQMYYAQYGSNQEFEKFMSNITFKGDREFSRLLFKKALYQSVAMIHNEDGEYGADGALTLQGAQAVGKTSLLRNMCKCFDLKYFKEGAEFGDGTMKDDILQNTSVFMCELGEGRKSMKHVDFMKRFITNPVDEIRAPYLRSAEKSPRLTTFYITVNDAEFLKDNENRRYWVVEIADISVNGMNSINYEALWAEVYSWYLESSTGFRLTHEERKQLNQLNEDFREYSLEESVLMDCLDWDDDISNWKERYASEIATEILSNTGIRILPQKVGSALKKLGYTKDDETRRYRKLRGKSLYSTPAVIRRAETGTPFDRKTDGKALDRFE